MSSGRATLRTLGALFLLVASCSAEETPVVMVEGPPVDAQRAEKPLMEEGIATSALAPWPRLDLPPETEATISWEEARDWVGKVVAVEGAIVRTHNSGKACFLGFGPYEEKTFTAVIFASSFGDYSVPPETLFADRRIRVSGRVKLYRDIPEIVIENPSQLVVLDS